MFVRHCDQTNVNYCVHSCVNDDDGVDDDVMLFMMLSFYFHRLHKGLM